MPAAVYAIRNVATGQTYVGRAANARRRRNEHMRLLRRGLHPNLRMQHSFAKYGEGHFAFEVLCICRVEDAPDYEYLFIRGLRTDDPGRGFNQTLAVDGHLTHTPEARAAIGAASRLQTPYVRTPEIRAKIAASLTGRLGHNKGRKWSTEVRAKMGAPKGHQNGLGRTRSPADRANIAAKIKAKWQDPEFRKMMLAARGPDVGHRIWKARRRNAMEG